MRKLTFTGRYLFAIAIAGIGCISLITNNLPSALFPLPPTMPGKPVLAWITGLVLIATAICILLNRKALTAAFVSGILFFIYLLYPHLPKLLSDIHDANEWVVFLETLVFCCGSFLLAGELSSNKVIERLALASKYLFAIALFIFGIQHFMYGQFILTLVPEWIPAKTFWLHLVKAGFILTAISIIVNYYTELALTLLGIMFLLWLFILHGSRVVAKPGTETEWTSFFIAMVMNGICFMLAEEVRSLKSEV